MDGGMFRELVPFIKGLMVIIVISVPLGLWKLIDIGIWLFERITSS